MIQGQSAIITLKAAQKPGASRICAAEKTGGLEKEERATEGADRNKCQNGLKKSFLITTRPITIY